MTTTFKTKIIPMKRFVLSFRAELDEDQLWPDGDGPLNPDEDDVWDVIHKCRGMISDWHLEEDLTIKEMLPPKVEMPKKEIPKKKAKKKAKKNRTP